MSVVKLFADNPKDGTTSFDKVRWYEANDSSGTGVTLIATSDINTANINPIDPGFTSYVYSSGSTSKYYASSWYNSSNTTETDKSAYVQGGQDRWDTMFAEEMQDTAAAVWSSTDRARFKTKALEALFPDFFYDTINTDLTVDNDTAPSLQYTLPFGIFSVAEVGVGKPNDTVNQPFRIVHPNNWRVEQNKLVFGSLSGLTDDYDIRLVCSKKYLEVGEVPQRLDPLVMYHLRMSAYIKMADDYPRFLTWARLQKGTKVSFENLRVHAREFERMFNAEKDRVKDLLPSGRI